MNKLPVNAAGVAASFLLSQSTAGSGPAVRISTDYETALAKLLVWFFF